VVNHGDRTEIVHRLRERSGALPRPLILPAGTELLAGSAIRVWGSAEGDAIRVVRHEQLDADEATRVAAQDEEPTTTNAAALVTAAKKPTRRWAFVLVDVDGGGNKIDKVKAQDVLFSPNRVDSIRSYFREVSYGVQDLEGEVFGPLPYAMNGRCDTDAVAQALLPQIPGRFDQYLWFYGTQQKACNWAGIAELGKAERPTRHSWYNAVSACNVLVQEPGHNFGMVHSSAMHCTLDGAPVTIAWSEQPGTISCSNEEYGNVFDPMGGGDCYHMDGVQKAYQDWLGGCNIVKATESGVFTIYPLESACEGAQLLQVPFPAPRPFGKAGVLSGYYLELRAPVGYRDRELDPQVLVVVGNDVREARFTGNRNWLLDMKPETPEVGDGALEVGKTFADALPGGPRFTLLSVDATHAVIKVELGKDGGLVAEQPGKGVCSDMTAFTAPGPSTCVAPPAGPPAAPRPDSGASNPAGGPDAGTSAPGSSPPVTDGPVALPAEGGSSGASGSGSRAGSPAPGGSAGDATGAPANTSAPKGGGCQFGDRSPVHAPDLIAVSALGLLGLVMRRRAHR
jgi:hypothetical protein